MTRLPDSNEVLPEHMQPDYYSMKQIAQHLNVSYQTVQRYVRLGKLKAYRFDNFVRIYKKDLQDFLATRRYDIAHKTSNDRRFRRPED